MAKQNSLQQLESVLNGVCQKTSDAMSEMKKGILTREQQVQYYAGLCFQHGIIDKDGNLVDKKKATSQQKARSVSKARKRAQTSKGKR